MTTIDQLLDQAKKARGIDTDSDLAKALGVTKAAVSGWRHGTRQPDTVTCATLAGLTGEPLAKVLGIVGEARAISREEKAVWRKLAATAALVALAYYIAPIGAMEPPHGAWAFLAAIPVEWLPAVGIMRSVHRGIRRLIRLVFRVVPSAPPTTLCGILFREAAQVRMGKRRPTAKVIILGETPCAGKRTNSTPCTGSSCYARRQH